MLAIEQGDSAHTAGLRFVRMKRQGAAICKTPHQRQSERAQWQAASGSNREVVAAGNQRQSRRRAKPARKRLPANPGNGMAQKSSEARLGLEETPSRGVKNCNRFVKTVQVVFNIVRRMGNKFHWSGVESGIPKHRDRDEFRTSCAQGSGQNSSSLSGRRRRRGFASAPRSS